MAGYVALAGALYSAYNQYQQGQDANEIAKRNQEMADRAAAENEIIAQKNLAIAEEEATALEAQGSSNVTAKKREIMRLLAFQRAQEGVSGFKYEGTPKVIAKQSTEEGEQDVATIWANAVTNAKSMREKGRLIAYQGTAAAEQLRAQGRIFALQGEKAAEAGYYGAGATLLSGVSNAMMINQGFTTTYTKTR